MVNTIYGQDRSISPQKISTPIQLDGVLNESVWMTTPSSSDFQMHYPYDSLPASSSTEVKMLFDEDNLYIGAVCNNAFTTEYVIQSLKRDFDFRENDAFVVFLDLFNDASGGMTFGVNPKGVQRDGIIPRGGTKGVQLNWDGLWEAEVFQSPDQKYWSVEMAIPLKTLRFSNKNSTWGINFARNDLSKNEVSTWSPVTRGFEVATLSQAGKVNWTTLPTPQNSKITIIPYSAISSEKNHDNNPSTTLKPKVGLDAKIALTSSLSFDFTINPDFSQVEVDQQVIDLNRFELFFPEKRLLFLENSDLFSGLGNSRVRPYFSRRIGSAGENPVPIHFGARLSGKINKDWQIGLMTVQTGGVESVGKESQNYSIAAIQKTILGGSSVSAFFASRQGIDGFYIKQNNFNRVGGLEFDFRSKNSLWTGKSFLHYSNSDGEDSNGFAYDGKIRYRSKKASLFFGIDGVGKNYLTDMGYVPRLFHENKDTVYRIAYNQLRSNGYYRFFSKNKNSKIDFWSVNFDINIFTDKASFSYQEHDADLGLTLRFLNSSELEFMAYHFSPRLFFPFTLAGLELPFWEGNYPNRKFSLSFDSGKLKKLYWTGRIGFGGEYEGNRFDLRSELNYRFKNFIVAGINFSQQNLSGFPEEYGQANFSLVGSKFEISFNRNLFFTTFLQYNTQTDNFNINSRFNWRFKPMSDLYLVYTENYLTENLNTKNRAIVLKVNYWLNL
ncbi:MAG: DUF5916 domain-containing protein [Saprospiraceae bacterium]